jgi:hypothetical protein
MTTMPQFDRLGNDMSDDIADALAEEAERAEMYYSQADELTGYEEHVRDEGCDMYVYCHRHPSVVVGNGMFDGVCGACEGEMDDHAAYCDWMEELVASGPTCTDNGYKPWKHGMTCREVFGDCHLSQPAYIASEVEIPF